MRLPDELELTIAPRGCGKLVRLIKECAKTGCPIITYSNHSKNFIKQKAHDMGYEIPEPYSVNEIAGRRIVLREINVLVDDVESILSKALDNYLGCHVVHATMSEQEDISHYLGADKLREEKPKDGGNEGS